MGIAAHPKIFKTNKKQFGGEKNYVLGVFFLDKALAFVKLLPFYLSFARVQNVEGVGLCRQADSTVWGISCTI